MLTMHVSNRSPARRRLRYARIAVRILLLAALTAALSMAASRGSH
ncbi:hypothetical protein [Lysobacter claricitrinus]